jgi:cytochrome c oxidase subunit 2
MTAGNDAMHDTVAPLSYFQTAGPAADPITRLGWGLAIVSIAVVVIIAVLLTLAIFRKRRQAADDPSGRQLMPEQERAGLTWIVVGTGISVVVLFACAVWTLFTLSAVAAPGAKPRLVVEVRAFQFWWRVRYLDEHGDVLLTTANEIHVPAGEPVRFLLSSGDVIHSFWVPALGGKMDVVPGQTNVTWLQGSQVGRYRGQCSEYCGAQHAHMALFVNVDSAADFSRWEANQRASAALSGPTFLAGAKTFDEKCSGCHAVQGTRANGALGPDLTHLMSRETIAAGMLANTPAGLKQWIGHTQAIKPGSEMPDVGLDTGELEAVVAYLTTLR